MQEEVTVADIGNFLMDYAKADVLVCHCTVFITTWPA